MHLRKPSLMLVLLQAGWLFGVTGIAAAGVDHGSDRGELEEQHCLASAPELPRPVTCAGGDWSTTTLTCGEARGMPRELLSLLYISGAGNLA